MVALLLLLFILALGNPNTKGFAEIVLVDAAFVLVNSRNRRSPFPGGPVVAAPYDTVGVSEAAAASSSSSLSLSIIEFQSDFGRGEEHLSAFLQEGDFVMYQTGTWTVDGVEVGDGSPPSFAFAKVDTIQLVWTHNCEHGVLRGLEMRSSSKVHNNNTFWSMMEVVEPIVDVEFGPEQLLARLPATWVSESEATLSSAVSSALQSFLSSTVFGEYDIHEEEWEHEQEQE